MKREPAPGNKKPYHPPRLVRYGDLAKLTGAKPGLRRDGGPGAPKTKAGGLTG